MRRITGLPIVVVLMTAAGAFAQGKQAAPPSVSCLGPEGESYLRDLLARVHQLEQELDAAKQAQLAEREKEARRLQAKETEISDRAAALSERERSRVADLEAAKLELEKLKAANARATDAEKQLAALRAAVEEANDARRRVEEEMATAKQATAREARAREGAETRIDELERRERTAAASPRRPAEATSPPAATESEVAPPSAASRTSPREQAEAAPSAQPSEGEVASAQLAAISGKSAPPPTADPREQTEKAPSAKASEAEIASAQLAAISGKSPPPAPSQPGPAEADEARRGERILPGEHVTLRVAKLEELDRTVEVGDDGSIELPLVGVIQAAGRTEPELARDLRERLTAYVREPRVEVSREGAEKPAAPRAAAKQGSEMDDGEAVRAALGTYSVEGRVVRPGTYELTAGTTITSAIAEAGGASFGARLDEVEIEHPKGGSDARREIVNVAKPAATGRTDVAIRAGDVVRVPGSPVWALPWGFVRIITFPFWYPFS